VKKCVNLFNLLKRAIKENALHVRNFSLNGYRQLVFPPYLRDLDFMKQITREKDDTSRT